MKWSPLLQINARYGLYEGRDKDFGYQSWYGRESCSWKNSEPCLRNTDKIIQGNTCNERI